MTGAKIMRYDRYENSTKAKYNNHKMMWNMNMNLGYYFCEHFGLPKLLAKQKSEIPPQNTICHIEE